jgi:hypothetical protein
MTALLNKYHRGLFFLSWLLLNLIQSAYTGLLDDEAYYWVYSRFLDWGYFDHPPMIALMIKAGYSLFPNPFGLRLFTVLMSTATLIMIDSLLEKQNYKLFYAIAASMFILQVGGMITVPDLPLMFFTALYFLVYKKFIDKQNLLYSILLGLVIALTLYSKYHAILIVVFTLFSFPGLLSRWQTYVAATIAGMLFVPHISWQFSHGLPSVNYHLFERNATEYKFAFTTEYLLGQVALAGPLIGWLLIYALFIREPANQFEKTLKWTTLGVYGTFLFATFKGRVEANWTVPAFIGLIILAHQYLNESSNLQKWIYRLLWPALILIFIVRIYMMADIVPAKWLKKDEFHKTSEWAQAIKDSAHGLPVVFLDSYQKPSQYWFWTGDTSFALNTIRYRRNNYNFWPVEKRLQGKRVYVVSELGNEILTERSNTASRKISGQVIDSFYSYSRVRVLLYSNTKLIQNENSLKANLFLSETIPATLPLYLLLYTNKGIPDHIIKIQHQFSDSVGETVSADISNIPAGKYKYKWAIESCIPNRPSLNSPVFDVEIKK